MADHDPTEAHRQEALDRVRTAYRGYATSGHDRRWTGGGQGAALLRVERDRWLAGTIDPVGTVLDLGCGGGDLALMLDAFGRRPERYVGLDLLEERVTVARRAVPWGEFVAGSADRLPFAEASVDTVVACTLLSSIREPFLRDAVAREIGRVLRPGGRLVIYDLRYPSPRNRSVIPINTRLLRRLFPGWPADVRTITLLPPIARSPLAASPTRYRFLSALPAFRSHLGVVLRRP